MNISREHSIRMADTCCERIGELLHEKDIQLHSSMRVVGELFLQLRTVEFTNGIKIYRELTINNFAGMTAEHFQQFEELAIKQLTK